VPTEYDPTELARLLGEGKSLHEIADIVDGPAVNEAAAANRRSLQEQRGALNAEAAPPGAEPQQDPVEAMIAAARRSGAPRGSERYIEAGLERLFEPALAGDARVTSQGTVDRQTAERWHDDAIQRQVANRERSGFTRPR
jgi:hypothetical protein